MCPSNAIGECIARIRVVDTDAVSEAGVVANTVGGERVHPVEVTRTHALSMPVGGRQHVGIDVVMNQPIVEGLGVHLRGLLMKSSRIQSVLVAIDVVDVHMRVSGVSVVVRMQSLMIDTASPSTTSHSTMVQLWMIIVEDRHGCWRVVRTEMSVAVAVAVAIRFHLLAL